jgi:hypothetical protein
MGEWKCQVHCQLRSYITIRNKRHSITKHIELIMELSMSYGGSHGGDCEESCLLGWDDI